MMDIKKGLASTVQNVFDKNTPGSIIENQNIPNSELAKELHKPIARTFKRKKVY